MLPDLSTTKTIEVSFTITPVPTPALPVTGIAPGNRVAPSAGELIATLIAVPAGSVPFSTSAYAEPARQRTTAAETATMRCFMSHNLPGRYCPLSGRRCGTTSSVTATRRRTVAP
jgi:hypothetical protein